MLDASAAFGLAVSGALVPWTPPRVWADWDDDGFGSPGGDAASAALSDPFSTPASNSWGSTPGGLAYFETGSPSVSASDFQVSGGVATMSVPVSGGYRLAYLNDSSIDADQDQTWTWSMPTMPLGAALEPCAVLLRVTSFNDCYMCRVSVNPDGSADCQITDLSGKGTIGALEPIDGLTVAASTQYKTRAQVVGTKIRMKTWLAADTEPGVWDLTVVDESRTSGGVGVRAGIALGNTNTKPVVFSFYESVAGYNETDDLTEFSDTIRVSHSFDDGMPPEIRFLTGTGTPTLSVGLAAGDDDDQDAGSLPSRYFSPFNAASPVYGYDRDIAPMAVSAGVITDNGPEYVQLFTGQMSDLPVNGSDASLTGISTTRLKLQKLVEPPVAWAVDYGLTGTWIVSWVLADCGIYASPPPRQGCRLWMPMHGSAKPFIPTEPGLSEFFRFYFNDADELNATGDPRYINSGPFVGQSLGMYSNASESLRLNAQFIPLADGDHMVSKAGNVGRVEFWIKGDTWAADPQGTPSAAVRFRIMNKSPDVGYAEVGVNFTTRRVYVTVYDGTTTFTTSSADTVPTDGEWHAVGGAWDIANNTCWTYLNGTAGSGTSGTALSTALLPAIDVLGGAAQTSPFIVAYAPFAELQVTAGTYAHPDNMAWVDQIDWERKAYISPSDLRPELIFQGQPIQAHELIGRVAQAELAAIRVDESDNFLYRTYGFWAGPDELTQVDTLTAAEDIESVSVRFDPTKIRNSVRVSYVETEVPSSPESKQVAELRTTLRIPPGITRLTLPLNQTTVAVDENVSAWTDMEQLSTTLIRFALSYATLNAVEDGSSLTYATDDEFTMEVTSWTPAGGVEVQIRNETASIWWLANDAGLAPLSIRGWVPTEVQSSTTIRDEPSIASRRGERSMQLSTMPFVHNQNDAARLARLITSEYARPIAIVEGMRVFGDPRRQPGDLVALEDAENTELSGLWRLMEVEHDISGPRYMQTVKMRRVTLFAGYYGESNYGEALYVDASLYP